MHRRRLRSSWTSSTRTRASRTSPTRATAPSSSPCSTRTPTSSRRRLASSPLTSSVGGARSPIRSSGTTVGLPRPRRTSATRRARRRLASAETAVGRPPRVGLRAPLGGAALTRGAAVLWISLIVLLPLAAVLSRGFEDGLGHFWDAISDKEAVAAIRLTLISSVIVVAINAVMGTLIAWVLVRDEFPGKRLVNSVIDLPFALPTIVASLVLLALYGPNSPVGIHAAYTRVAVVMALLFVTLPFVIRAVQPVLIEVDREMEEAADS